MCFLCLYAGGHWLLTEHPHLFHRRMGCTVISDYPGIFSRHLLRRHSVGLRFSAFFRTVQLIEQEWRPILWYFMFKTKPSSVCHSLLGLPCVTCQSFCQLFSVSSQSFISILAQSVATMHCAVCFKFLSNSKEHQAVSILSNRQQKVSEGTLCGCYCRRRITSVTDRNRQRRDRLFMHSNEKYQFHLFKQLLCGYVCGNLREVF